MQYQLPTAKCDSSGGTMPSFGPSSDNFGLPNWGSGHGGASLITLPFYIRWALQVTRLSQTNNYNKNKNKNRNKNKNKNTQNHQ